MDARAVRAPLAVPVDLVRPYFGDDAIIRTDAPTTLRCGGIDIPAAATLGTNCRSGCKTQDHATWGDCLRDAGVRTYLASPSKGLDGTRQKKWDSELALYRDARAQGIQPDSTNRPDIEKALKLSEMRGAAYGRDFDVATPMED